MRIILFFILALFTHITFAQVAFDFNAHYMNRAEYRHGFNTLASPDQDAAFFITQRARFMATASYERVSAGLSIQDIRTWGNTSNVAIDNRGLLSVHEAWLALQLNDKVKLKMGRQEIKYDEDRIFGNLDWAMQARRHDAAILMFEDSATNTLFHVGAAFNQDDEPLAGTLYLLPNNYKTFQFAFFSKPFGQVDASFLFLNNGYQFQRQNGTYTTVFSQTFGPRLISKQADSGISWNATFYLQIGRNSFNQSLKAFNTSGELTYHFTPVYSLTGGFEILSGTSQLSGNVNESQSFDPFYGTNHRFNGYMDYFYVGNHLNSVGLQDLYVKGRISHQRTIYSAALHFFSSYADVFNDVVPGTAAGRYLGTELDLFVSYNFWSAISLQVGYSQMMATRNMEYLKNVPDGSRQTNNWMYAMVIWRPGTTWPKVGLKI